jgi:hypothetical protein
MKDIVIVEAVRSAVGRATRARSPRCARTSSRARSSRGSRRACPQVKPSDVEDSSSAAPCPRASRASTSRARRLPRRAAPQRRHDHQPLLLERPSGHRAGGGRHRDRLERHRHRRRRGVDEHGADDRQQAQRPRPRRWPASRRCTRPWASRPRTSPSASRSRARTRTSSPSPARRRPAARRPPAGSRTRSSPSRSPITR